MLGKLLKYEVKATWLIFMMMYLAILGFALFNRVFSSFEFEWGIVTTMGILVALFVGLGVLTIVMAVQRFNKNLLGDEGYLMFTLPVKSKELIVSKLLVTIMWTIISGIVAMLAFMILFSAYTDWESIKMGIYEFKQSVMYLNEELISNINISVGGLFSFMGIGFLLSYVRFILVVYTSLVIGQLPAFSKHRGISAFGAFFVLNIIGNNILTALGASILRVVDISQLSAKLIMGGGILVIVVVDIVLFFVIDVILNKHLNLE